MKYSEGTCFLVRLEDSGYAVSVIARANKRGSALLTYHFAPRYDEIPDLEVAKSLDPRMPVLVARTGNLYLKSGRWPTLGVIEGWRRSDWPMPEFLRQEPITNRRIAVTYSEEDPGKFISEETASAGFHGPIDASWGCGAIESWMTVALTPESEDKGIDNPVVMTTWSKQAFITSRGKTLAVPIVVGAPVKDHDGYTCQLDAGPLFARVIRISGANPERARRNAMNILRVAVLERKAADEEGRILDIPIF